MDRPLHPLVRAVFTTAFLCAATAAPAQPAADIAPDTSATASEASEEQVRPKRPALPSKNSRLVSANEAKRRLAQTESHRSMGVDPLPGEITRGPGGMTVNYRYWKRQEKLRVEVDQALRRVNLTEKRLQPRTTSVAALN